MGKGYKNIIIKDPLVHSMSAKGMKQKTSLNPIIPPKPYIVKSRKGFWEFLKLDKNITEYPKAEFKTMATLRSDDFFKTYDKDLYVIGKFKDLFSKGNHLVVRSIRGDIVRELIRRKDGTVLIKTPTDIPLIIDDDFDLLYESWTMDAGSILFVRPDKKEYMDLPRLLKLLTENDEIEVVLTKKEFNLDKVIEQDHKREKVLSRISYQKAVKQGKKRRKEFLKQLEKDKVFEVSYDNGAVGRVRILGESPKSTDADLKFEAETISSIVADTRIQEELKKGSDWHKAYNVGKVRWYRLYDLKPIGHYKKTLKSYIDTSEKYDKKFTPPPRGNLKDFWEEFKQR